jgi:hypothetical protein
VTLKVIALGTAPVRRVEVIKDFHHAFSAEPNGRSPRVEFTWTDDEDVNRGPSWYYVRLTQDDGQIAWGSPIWATRPAPAR